MTKLQQPQLFFDQALVDQGDHVLVAVSGGADSMVLLQRLHEQAKSTSYKLSAVHINYGLRGEDSLADQKLVQQRCKDLDIFLTLHSSDELSLSDSNLEEKARTIRHQVLRETAKEIGANKIALGHTLDDQAETLLMHLLRGTGLRGLIGMQKRDGLLIRPLLDSKRVDVREYAQANKIPYHDDRTNEDLRFMRNKIRHLLMPLLSKNFNANIQGTLAHTAHLLREDEHFLAEMSQTMFKQLVKKDISGVQPKFSISAQEFINLPLALQRRLLRIIQKELLGTAGNLGHGQALQIALDTLKKSEAGMKLDLGHGLTLERKAGILSVTLPARNASSSKNKFA